MPRVEDAPASSVHEVYGAILTVDLQGYSRSELSELDRSRLREAQQRVIWEAISTVLIRFASVDGADPIVTEYADQDRIRAHL